MKFVLNRLRTITPRYWNCYSSLDWEQSSCPIDSRKVGFASWFRHFSTKLGSNSKKFSSKFVATIIFQLQVCLQLGKMPPNHKICFVICANGDLQDRLQLKFNVAILVRMKFVLSNWELALLHLTCFKPPPPWHMDDIFREWCKTSLASIILTVCAWPG
jgi:hypothetical protein